MVTKQNVSEITIQMIAGMSTIGAFQDIEPSK